MSEISPDKSVWLIRMDFAYPIMIFRFRVNFGSNPFGSDWVRIVDFRIRIGFGWNKFRINPKKIGSIRSVPSLSKQSDDVFTFLTFFLWKHHEIKLTVNALFLLLLIFSFVYFAPQVEKNKINKPAKPNSIGKVDYWHYVHYAFNFPKNKKLNSF